MRVVSSIPPAVNWSLSSYFYARRELSSVFLVGRVAGSQMSPPVVEGSSPTIHVTSCSMSACRTRSIVSSPDLSFARAIYRLHARSFVRKRNLLFISAIFRLYAQSFVLMLPPLPLPLPQLPLLLPPTTPPPPPPPPSLPALRHIFLRQCPYHGCRRRRHRGC